MNSCFGILAAHRRGASRRLASPSPSRRPGGPVRALLAVCATVALASCGGEDAPTTPPPVEPSRPAEISVEPDTFIVTAGATVSLRRVVLDQRGKIISTARVTWDSSDPSVATVDTAGVVTGVREGRATVSASIASISASAAGTIRSQDRNTLVDLMNLTGGGNWTNSENWGSDEPVGTWHGVDADANGRVTALRLSDNGLSGQLPTDLGDLALLTELHVDGNEDLSGPIPVSLAALDLQQLQYGGTALCTVRDEAFRSWLNAVPESDGDFLACNEERSDLMKLYEAMGGDGWANSANWGTNAPLGNWFGIQVDTAGRVTGINLNRNSLTERCLPKSNTSRTWRCCASTTTSSTARCRRQSAS